MSTIIFNKKIVSANAPCIRHNDRGFTLGHGLFETILIKKSTIPALAYHWRRLEASAPILGIILPFSHRELETMLKALIVKNNLQDKLAGARVTITHGEAERGILPKQAPQTNFLITVFECAIPVDRPYTALIVKTRKNECTIAARVKSISYLDNILAKQEAMNQGYDEAILLNTASNVADGAISNIYMIKDGRVFTPPVSDGALPGIVRNILIDNFSAQFPIIEKSISPAELMAADEVFLTNALMGIKPVIKINDVTFNASVKTNEIKKILFNFYK